MPRGHRPAAVAEGASLEVVQLDVRLPVVVDCLVHLSVIEKEVRTGSGGWGRRWLEWQWSVRGVDRIRDFRIEFKIAIELPTH